jgi:DNA-binding MarR family transcriptional regulator
LSDVDSTRQNVLLQVFVAGELVGELLTRELRETQLTPDHFAVLSVIGMNEPITPSRLAGLLGMPRTTLSYWIRDLSERGQIERTPNPEDGRSVQLAVTRAGQEVLARAIPVFERALHAVNAELGADREEVQRSFGALHDAVRKLLSEGSTKSNYISTSS